MSETDKTILIVDDTPLNLDVLRRTLEAQNYKITIALNGKIACDIVEKIKPSLILLDIMMPEMDGYEVCQFLKSNAKTKEIPVIFMSAKTEVRDVLKGFQLGAADYIFKPFNRAEVCARVKNHIDLYITRQGLIELNRLKSKFLSIASHDLRTPLSGILGYIKMMREERGELSDTQVDNSLDKIILIIDSMFNLINELLDLTTLDSCTYQLQTKAINFSTLVLERIDLLEFTAKNKNIIIITELTEITILCDRDKIALVIDNLLSNAIKFSEPNKTITIHTLEEEKGIQFIIQDEGPGILDKESHKLFHEFQKLSTQPTAGENSTGLGLSITKKVIERHNGRIGLLRNDKPGACFYFSLPQTKTL